MGDPLENLHEIGGSSTVGEVPVTFELLGDRDRIEGMFALVVEFFDGREDAAVGVEIEVLGDESVSDVVEDRVFEQDTAQKPLFGLKILGGEAIGTGAVGAGTVRPGAVGLGAVKGTTPGGRGRAAVGSEIHGEAPAGG